MRSTTLLRPKLLVSCVLLVTTGCGGGGSDSPGTLDESFAISSANVEESNSGPTTVITTGPDLVTSDPFAVFVFASEDAVKFECEVDRGGSFPCASPLPLPMQENSNLYAALTHEEHEITVTGISSDDVSGEPASWVWEVVSVLSQAADDLSTQRLIDSQVVPLEADTGDWKGIFRINCEFDRASYDDPIVFPGMHGAAHLHMFYGSKNVDADTDFASLNSSESAGCSGGVLNRSAYWTPALLAPLYNATSKERELDDNGDPAWQVVLAKVGEGERTAAAAHELFYYSAAIDDLGSITSPPVGLRIIAGSGSNTPESTEQSTSIARWHCLSWGSSDANGGPFSATIPDCYADVNTPEMIRFDIFFPSCWNGVDLDSPDHKSHMAYPVTGDGERGLYCPDSHPVPIARVSYHYSFPIFPSMLDPITSTAKDFRLASDDYTVSGSNGGRSIHGDWFNAWHPEVLDMLVAGCIKGGLDCHDGNLALQSVDGSWSGSLSLGPLIDAKGSQDIPAIVNRGLGTHSH